MLSALSFIRMQNLKRVRFYFGALEGVKVGWYEGCEKLEHSNRVTLMLDNFLSGACFDKLFFAAC